MEILIQCKYFVFVSNSARNLFCLRLSPQKFLNFYDNFDFLKAISAEVYLPHFMSILANCSHKENWCNGKAFYCNGTYFNHNCTCEDFYDNSKGDDTCFPGKPPLSKNNRSNHSQVVRNKLFRMFMLPMAIAGQTEQKSFMIITHPRPLFSFCVPGKYPKTMFLNSIESEH